MSFWHEYAEVMTNPGHSAAEGTFSLLEFLIASVIWARVIKPAWKKMLRREHDIIDTEHNHVHTIAPSKDPLLPSDETTGGYILGKDGTSASH